MKGKKYLLFQSLMMLLDISKLNKLESQFKKHSNGISKDQFIR